MDLLDAFTRLIVPPILGGIAGLITTWVAWDIEKRRMRVQRRRELVEQWRKELITALPEKSVMKLGHGGPRYDFMLTPAYSSLRPHLSEGARKVLEGSTTTIVVGDADHPRRLIMDEIGRIEKEWGLV